MVGTILWWGPSTCSQEPWTGHFSQNIILICLVYIECLSENWYRKDTYQAKLYLKTDICVGVWVCIYTHKYIHTSICMYVSIYVHIYVYVYMCMCIYVFTYMCMYIHINMCMYIHLNMCIHILYYFTSHIIETVKANMY